MICLEGVTKRFRLPNGDETTALDGVDLSIRRGETLCLIGGSGSGKTTALRLINRLADPDDGRILVNDSDIAKLDPIQLRRSMGYVVQSGALFPHLTVERNVGLLCELEEWEASRTRDRVDELLRLVQLEPNSFRDRYPNELSGGQQQRVGVARALALDPDVILLDEPFGALDPITRRQLQSEFQELSRVKERTVVFVTHDLDEAFALGDRVALLEAGRVLQVDTPELIRSQPANDHVAAFVAHHLGRSAS